MAGLLDAVYSGSDSIKRRVKGLLSDPVGYMQQIGGLLQDDMRTESDRQKRMIHDPQSITRQDVEQSLASAMSFAPLGMTVWHGSPHKFTKFDMSKIGTGEGAQAYGHGLYMAENPSVAKTYIPKVSDEDIARKFWDALDNAGDGYIGIRGDNAVVKNTFRKSWNRPDGIKTTRLPGTSVVGVGADNITEDVLLNAVKKARGYGNNVYLLEGDAPTNIQWLANDPGEKLLSNNKVISRVLDKESGNIYKVDIPDEAVARMLDWDKKLSEQAPEVQKALQQAAELRAKQTGGAFGPMDMQQLAKDLIPTMGEGRLKQAGIPGVRYLDGGSRSAGQGSSNFVLFDDQLPRILEINGQPTGNAPWRPGEWRGLLGN